MVEGQAHITIKGVTRCIQLNDFEIAQIIADREGFDVVDFEPMPGGWRVRAYINNGKSTSSVSFSGSSRKDVVTRLVEGIT